MLGGTLLEYVSWVMHWTIGGRPLGFYLSLGILSRKGETSFVSDMGLVHNTQRVYSSSTWFTFLPILSRSLRRPTNMSGFEIAGIVLAISTPHLINRTAVAIKYVAVWLLRRADIEHPI